MLILTGDIGGTHTRLSMCELTDRQLRFSNHQTFSSPTYASLQAIIEDYTPASTAEAAALYQSEVSWV